MGKSFFIIASNFQAASTGGLIWINKLAEYAQKKYEKTAVIDLTKSNIWIRNNRFLDIIHYLLYLLWRNNFFVFIDHSLHLRFGVPLLASYFLKKNRYAVICHHIFYKIRKNTIRRRIEYLSEKIFLKNARIIIVPSKKTYLDIQKFKVDKKKIVIINPTYTFKSKKLPQRKFQNKILFVGTLEPRKRVDIIIKALSLIKNSNFTLDIIGGYHKQEKYFVYLRNIVKEHNLSDKVIFHCRVDSKKLINFYRNANIFVFPSMHEGYGMVLLEAMSFGIPIVATDIPTTREIVENNVNGYLCPVDDVMCLSQGIKTLLVNQNLQAQMGKRNFAASRKFRSWDEVVKQTFASLHPYLS